VPVRASYFDGCPTTHALDLIGDRWALIVVRELLLGPKRFTDLRRGLPRISSNVLAQRLHELDAADILRRRTLPPPAASAVYELTQRGLDLEPVLTAIGRWGAASPELPNSDSLGVDTFVLGLRSTFDGAAAAGVDASYELRAGDEAFAFDIADGELAIHRGGTDAARPVLEVDPTAMAGVARGATPLAKALSPRHGSTPRDVKAFTALFAAPHRRR
jgi:DNA-binding HxlR family transcriptional regulator